jgi:anti-sigma factor RsiW
LKHDDLDKRVSAYVDGALRGSKREQLERELQLDERLARQLTRSRALGRAVREAWTDGPPAPAPEYLLAAIRPAMLDIDRERRARPTWQRRLEVVLARLSESLRPSPALAAAAAFAFVAALAVMPRLQATQGLLAGDYTSSALRPAAAPVAPSYSSSPASLAVGPFGTMPTDFTTDGSGSVYDLSPGRPAVLFRGKDGSVTLWIIDEGDLSYRLGAGGLG